MRLSEQRAREPRALVDLVGGRLGKRAVEPDLRHGARISVFIFGSVDVMAGEREQRLEVKVHLGEEEEHLGKEGLLRSGQAHGVPKVEEGQAFFSLQVGKQSQPVKCKQQTTIRQAQVLSQQGQPRGWNVGRVLLDPELLNDGNKAGPFLQVIIDQ